MQFAEQIAAHRPALLAAVPYMTLPGLAPNLVFEPLVRQQLQEFTKYPEHFRCSVGVEEQQVVFLYRHLSWNTAFFGRAMARLQAVVFGPAVLLPKLTAAIQNFSRHLPATGHQHSYCEVAASDSVLLTALARADWATVETRLHYYHILQPLPATRYPVRRVAATTCNPTGPFFTPEQGDAFLGEYAAATVRGYADLVLLPQQEPLDSFLAIGCLATGLPARDGKLTAVGARNQDTPPLTYRNPLALTVKRHPLCPADHPSREPSRNAQLQGTELSTGSLTYMLSWQVN